MQVFTTRWFRKGDLHSHSHLYFPVFRSGFIFSKNGKPRRKNFKKKRDTRILRLICRTCFDFREFSLHFTVLFLTVKSKFWTSRLFLDFTVLFLTVKSKFWTSRLFLDFTVLFGKQKNREVEILDFTIF